MDKVPKHDVTMILGDFNAQVGREVEAFDGVKLLMETVYMKRRTTMECE